MTTSFDWFFLFFALVRLVSLFTTAYIDKTARKLCVTNHPCFVLLEGRRESRISPTSEAEISDSDSPSPSTSRDSEEFATNGEKLPDTSSREPPIIVISDTDCVPQVSHSIDEEENSSNEVIAASKETVTDFAGRVEANTAPLPTNPGQHDLLTLSIDSNLGKPSQMEVPSFLSLSQKSNLIVSPFDSVISAPVAVEAMYVTETLTVNPNQRNLSERGERREVAFKQPEVSDNTSQSTGRDPSDPKAPFTFTLSSSDSKVSGASSKDPSGAPPCEERMAMSSEEDVPREAGETEHRNSIAVSDNNSGSCQGNSSETEFQSTRTETFTASVNDTTESCDAQGPINNSVSPDAYKTQVPVTGGDRCSDDVASNQQSFEREAPQSHRGKAIDSPRAKAVRGSVVRDLFDPLRKQIPQSAEYTQLYTCGILDTPVISSRSQAHETISLTSLASASTETIHSESFESMDVNTGASDEKSTILKCITDNSFLEFLITEGLDLDARSKQSVVEVVMTQYSNKLSRVESTIPKLAAQIRDTETTIVQQTEKVKQLQEELEFVKGEIVKNENLLRGFINEQQGLSKHRKALKRKVARCEGTMKKLLGDAKKVRLE